jgi:peptide/nickel transport system substrate-binding protein
MKKPWFFSYWFGRPSEDWIFTLTYSKDSAQNETYWKNDRFNELLVSARAEFDRAKRKDMYGEMQKIVHEDGGAVVPLFVNDLMVAKDTLAHDTVAGNLELDGLKLPERWWFA